jgi:hypothetical protein
VVLSEDTEHVYAMLEQTHLQQPTIAAQQNETVLTEQTQQTRDILLETVNAPANLGEHQNSMTNASQDFPASNEPDKKTDESIPIYSKPDMSKKREERRRKRELKEQEERTVALEKVSFPSSPPPPQVTELEREPRKSDAETSIERGLGVVIDGQQQTDSDNNHLEFGKQLQIGQQSNNPDDKVPQGNDESLYDAPTSLDLIPKRVRSQNITPRKKKEDNDGEEES